MATAKLTPAASPTCTVRTPKLFHFDATTNTQVQEYLENGVDLKNYALRYYASPTDPALESQCFDIGRGLGQWLRGFHDWTKLPEQSAFREQMKLNTPMQSLKNTINYSWVFQRVDLFPDILADVKGVLEEVREMTLAELTEESQLQVIHGDFWTGK